jgi:hypothetical protein
MDTRTPTTLTSTRGRRRVGLVAALIATAVLLVFAATASASRPITHACPNPHVANVSQLRAGYVSGAYKQYAADCAGAASIPRSFVASKCATDAYLFRTKAGSGVWCNINRYDTCLAYKWISRSKKVLEIACEPIANRNAVITFGFHFHGAIPAPQSVSCPNEPKEDIYSLTGPSCAVAQSVAHAYVRALDSGRLAGRSDFTLTVNGASWRFVGHRRNATGTIPGTTDTYEVVITYRATSEGSTVAFRAYGAN